jgi:hypothetical protein
VALYEGIRCVPDRVRFDTKTRRKGVASIMATGLLWTRKRSRQPLG